MRGAVLTILLILCAVMFYILVIMGDSPKVDLPVEEIGASQPLASMPQETLHFGASDLYQVESYFNASILKLADNSGWKLDSVTVMDYVPDGVGSQVREVRLRYLEPSTGSIVAVSSITPSTCLRSLPARGFYASTDQEWMIGGMKAVMMRKGTTINLHSQLGEVVYQIEGDVEVDLLRRTAGMIEL